MLSREQLRENLECVMQEEIERIFVTVPYASHLTDQSQELNEAYYIRHRVETIKRIRMTSKTDALALAHMVDEDYDAARWWSRYTMQELSHDLLFLKDLRQHGYTEEQVAKIEPFPSTKAMLNYLTTKIESIGSLPAVAYSIFVEWNSERCSATVVEKVERQYSKSHVTGSKAHVGIDANEDHYGMMLDIAQRLVIKHSSEKVLIDLIRDISSFFSAYFRELYEETITLRESGTLVTM